MRAEICINGELVDLGPSAWELELVNSMFDFSRPAGSRAYNIDLIDTERNRRILGYLGNAEIRTEGELYYTEISKGGNLLDKGYSIIQDSSGGVYKLSFTSNLAEFFGVYQSKLLSEIDFGTITVSNWASTLSNTWNSGGFVAPTVKNTIFYDKNAPVGWNGVVNEWSGGAYTAQVKVPMFFWKYIMQRVADMAGVKFVGTAWNSDFLNKLLIVNMRAYEGTAEIRKHLPDLTVAEALIGLKNLFGLVLRFDVKAKQIRVDFAKDILSKAAVIDYSGKFRQNIRGSAIWTDGLKLKMSTDGTDGLSKDSFFFDYETPIVGTSKGGYVNIETPWSGLMMDGGLPTVQVQGVGSFQPDKKFGARLLWWIGGGSPVASNALSGVVMKWGGSDGLKVNFWNEIETLRKSSFVADEVAYLEANDVAKLGNILRGEVSDIPVIHAWGNDWVVERILVGDGSVLGKMKIWRK